MRRYWMLLTSSLILLVIALFAVFCMADEAKQGEHPAKQEMTAYTTLPPEVTTVLTEAYEASTGVRVRFQQMDEAHLMDALKWQAGGKDGVPLVVTDRQTLEKAAEAGYLVPYISETNDMVPENLRQKDGYWTGVWYDPMVFIVNRDYMKTLAIVPDTWQDLSRGKARIGVTDFMASDAAANLLYSQMQEYGDQATLDIWKRIHPQVVQYARYLSNPVRQAGMGEVDIAVSVESEALRYIHDGYPLKFVYPADGTAAIVTGTGITFGADSKAVPLAENFADWLLTDEAQLALGSHDFFFLTTNPNTITHKIFPGKNIVLFAQSADLTKEQEKKVLDRWAREVRFQ